MLVPISMGLAFVLIIWAVVGAALASTASVVLTGVCALVTRHRPRRTLLLVSSAVFPFASLIWMGGVFVACVLVNEAFLERDFGIGDGFRCPLPNGYSLSMIDVLDHAEVRSSSRGYSGVDGVQLLQVQGDLLLGARDSHGFERRGNPDAFIDGYFLIDTASGERRDFAALGDLQAAAARQGVPLHLESIGSVYARYRSTWVDYLGFVLQMGPPFTGLFVLVTWTLRVRRRERVGVGRSDVARAVKF